MHTKCIIMIIIFIFLQSYVYSTVPSGDYDLQIFLSNMTYSLNDSFELNELNITELYIVQYEDGNVGIIKVCVYLCVCWEV